MAGGARRWSGRQKGKPARQRNSSLLVSARQLQAHVRQQPSLFAVVKGTIASKDLVLAYRAFLYIAADDMQLPFEHNGSRGTAWFRLPSRLVRSRTGFGESRGRRWSRSESAGPPQCDRANLRPFGRRGTRRSAGTWTSSNAAA